MQNATSNPAIETETAAIVAPATDAPATDATETAATDKPENADKPATDKPSKPSAKPEPTAAELRVQAEQTAFDIFTRLSAHTVSIPVKPVASFKAYDKTCAASFDGRTATPRRAAAVYIAAFAAGLGTSKFADGITFPRKFIMRKTEYCLDNGAIKRCTQAGLITYDAETETITLRNAKLAKSAIRTTGFKL